MNGRLSAAAAASSAAADAAASFPEENGIVLDKWLMDVCGEEDLQFPSHRRAQYPAYLDRLRRVSRARQFIANTFDYPSRSGTREVLVLQKTLEALAAEEQRVRREMRQVQENVTMVRKVLDERTMGASTIVEEEKAQEVKLAEMQAEQQRAKAAAAASGGAPSSPVAAAQQQQQQQQTQAAAAARQQGYAPLNAATPVTVVTVPAARPTSSSSPAAAATSTTTSATAAGGAGAAQTRQPPLPESAEGEVSAPSSAMSSRSANATAATSNTFSAVARAARRADYEKKKALSLRYITEVEAKTQAAAVQRAEVQARHARLLAEKEQLAKEYAALQTTEALVVARHEEAEAHEHEETAQLSAETAALAAEEAAFAEEWEEMGEKDGDDGEQQSEEAAAAVVTSEQGQQQGSDPAHSPEDPSMAEETEAAEERATPPPPMQADDLEPQQQHRDDGHDSHHEDPSCALPDSPPLSPADSGADADGGAAAATLASTTATNMTTVTTTTTATATASVSLSPGERDASPPEHTLNTHRPPSRGTDSVASSAHREESPPHSLVERTLLPAHGSEDDVDDYDGEAEGQADGCNARPAPAEAATASPSPAPEATATARGGAPSRAAVAAADKAGRRALLEELRRRLSDLGAATLASRRQLLNTSQMHMGRFRQSQQRLKDWQDMAAQLRTTAHQLRGQVDVVQTAVEDAVARLDRDGAAAAAGSTYGSQLAKLNAVLRERSYETFQYYVGGGEAAAVEMMLDANAEEELRALHRPSPSAAAGGMTPVRGVGGAAVSAASSATPTRAGSLASAYNSPGGLSPSSATAAANNSSSNDPQSRSRHNSGSVGAVDAPHRHRSRYELVRHLQRWESVLLADRLAIVKAANMEALTYNGAGPNRKKAEGYNATRCYQELRRLLIQQKGSS